MKRQRNNAQMKEQTRNTEVQINDLEIGKLPEKEFRIMRERMIKNFEKRKRKKENSTELQKPKVELEVYNNNKKCD